MAIKKGLIQIYTGEGKGKTTAAIGLAIRAIAHKLKVCFVSFHKDPAKYGYGEYKILKKLGIDIYCFAKKHPHCTTGLKKDKLLNIRKQCLKGLEFIQKICRKNKYDILILDEINICVRDGTLREKEVLEALDSKPKNLELILTGRGATEKMIEKAELVSQIKKIKHPYDKGIKGREGIEY